MGILVDGTPSTFRRDEDANAMVESFGLCPRSVTGTEIKYPEGLTEAVLPSFLTRCTGYPSA